MVNPWKTYVKLSAVLQRISCFSQLPCIVDVQIHQAWLQLNEGKGPVTAVFKTGEGFTHAGSAIAQSGCWSMLKGGLTGNASGPAEIYFQVTTDANGFFETFLFHNAEYQIKIIHSAIGNSSSSVHNFKVPEASIADFDSSGQSTIMFLQVST
ncbi:hypothetical protein LWI29_014799 [Acer saccharum]|uniref:Uncharacterized protein n=1 Tax=Acer saccharum TaxID=4024 RepID=A0AA39RWI0_ACESA|nr:hypothetical protein LWI29_014799 [Acer saccharum]